MFFGDAMDIFLERLSCIKSKNHQFKNYNFQIFECEEERSQISFELPAIPDALTGIVFQLLEQQDPLAAD